MVIGLSLLREMNKWQTLTLILTSSLELWATVYATYDLQWIWKLIWEQVFNFTEEFWRYFRD